MKTFGFIAIQESRFLIDTNWVDDSFWQKLNQAVKKNILVKNKKGNSFLSYVEPKSNEITFWQGQMD